MDPKLESVCRLAADAAMNGAMVHGIRSTGASTAALVAVASGGIDIYWLVLACHARSAQLADAKLMTGTLDPIHGTSA